MTEGEKPKVKSKQKKDKDKGKGKASDDSNIAKDVASTIIEEDKVEVTEPYKTEEVIGTSTTMQSMQEYASKETTIQLVEVRSESGEIIIGPKRITRFEKARIVGARALQLSLGASPLVPVPKDSNDPISIAEYELKQKALPISIRRILPDGHYQDIPIIWLLVN